MNIYDALNEYKQYLLIEKKISDNTLKNYMRDLEHFINYIQKQNQVVLINQIRRGGSVSERPRGRARSGEYIRGIDAVRRHAEPSPYWLHWSTSWQKPCTLCIHFINF